MNWFTHRPSSRSRRLLPGHAHASAYASLDGVPVPGVDASERRRQRVRWGTAQTRRFDRTELTSRVALGVAVAVMALVMLAAMASPTNSLERAHLAQTQADAAAVQVDAAPFVGAPVDGAPVDGAPLDGAPVGAVGAVPSDALSTS